MTSTLYIVLAFLCIGLAVGLFFFSSFEGFINYWLRKFWNQSEKTYLNFELMFLDEKFPMSRCRLLVVFSSVFMGLLAGFVTLHAPSRVLPVAMVIGAFIGWRLPNIITLMMHKRYVVRFDEQILDGVSMLGSGLGSGLSLIQAMELAASEMPKPLSQEFRLMLNEYNYGITIDDAMARMAARIPSPDLWIVIESILILRDTGANLVETFDIIIHTIRERKKVEEKVKTLTSMGVAQAVILLALPFLLMFVLSKMNPEYMVPLFTTNIGWVMIGVMLVMMTLGAVLIKNIITIKV